MSVRTCRTCGGGVARPDCLYCEDCRRAAKETVLAEERSALKSLRQSRRASGQQDPWHSDKSGARRGVAISRRNKEAWSGRWSTLNRHQSHKNLRLFEKDWPM